MKYLLAATIMMGTLSGCISPAVRSDMQRQIDESIPVCDNKRQCDAQWSAANTWVANNCGMKIQTANDIMIQTYNSVDSSTNTSCHVQKQTAPDGRSAIVIRIGCANIFGCVPDSFSQVISFNNYVKTAGEPFASLLFGINTSEQVDSKGKPTVSIAMSYGVKVNSVAPGSPAELANMQPGDIIIAVNGERIRSSMELDEARAKIRAGDIVKVTVNRGGVESDLEVSF